MEFKQSARGHQTLSLLVVANDFQGHLQQIRVWARKQFVLYAKWELLSYEDLIKCAKRKSRKAFCRGGIFLDSLDDRGGK